MVQFPVEEAGGVVPAAVLDEGMRSAVTDVRELAGLAEGEAEWVEVAFEAHDAQRAQRGGAVLGEGLLETRDRGHRVGCGPEADVPEDEFGGGASALE